jgi:hypothetical protein
LKKSKGAKRGKAQNAENGLIECFLALDIDGKGKIA